MKIKICKILACTLLSFLMIPSCMDLTEKPKGFLTPGTYYQNYDQCQLALVGAAGVLAPPTGGMYTSYQPFADGIYNRAYLGYESSYGSLYWQGHWTSIRNLNPVIGAIRAGNLAGHTQQDDVKDLLGQALFWRAFNYFYLVQFYGKIPWIDEKTRDVVAEPLTPESRREVSFIYDQIEADLIEAFASMADYNSARKGRPCKWSAKALLSKVYLTRATAPLSQTDYFAKARDAAEEVILSGKYRLLPLDQIFKSSNANNEEFIFAFQYSSDHPSLHGKGVGPPDWGSLGGLSINRVFVEEYPEQPRKHYYLLLNWPVNIQTETDPLKWNWRAWNDPNGFPGARSTKMTWPNLTVQQQFTEYGTHSGKLYPVLRITEMYLIYAEAANMANNAPTQQAVDYLNTIIKRANTAFGSVFPLTNVAGTEEEANMGMDKDEFNAKVLQERKYELFMEHTTYFDVLRTKTLEEANLWTGDVVNRFSPKDYLWPIPPLDVLDIGNNPGYE